jgi:hypothetical protein
MVGVVQRFGKMVALERPIHPKCGEEACDLVAHSSKEWRRSMWLGEPIHPKCGGRSMWLGGYSSKSVRGGTNDLGIQSVFGRKRWRAWNGERGETNDFGGNEYANPNFYTSPFLHNSYITCFLRKQYHKGWPTTTCLWKEAMMLMV